MPVDDKEHRVKENDLVGFLAPRGVFFEHSVLSSEQR